MEQREKSAVERAADSFCKLLKEYKVPIISAWAATFAAHMYMFANKIVNHDEAMFLYGKGWTITSGRWLLELSRYIFPDFSVPWFYGLLSIAITCVAICLVIKLFDIRSRYLQAALAAVTVAFPGQTSIFCFMFTSAPYAVALVGSVWAVYLYSRGGGLKRFLLSGIILTLALGIYQGYVALSASLFIILMIQALLRGETAKKVFTDGVKYVALLAASLAAYYVITRIVSSLSGIELLEYAYAETGLIFRILLAYNGFIRSFTDAYFGFVNSGMSALAHFAAVAAVFAAVIGILRKGIKLPEAALLILCVGLLPVSTYCIYLIAETGVINTWSMYSFVCVYILAAVIADLPEIRMWFKDVILVSLVLVIISDVFFANKVYLKMQLGNESIKAYYTALASDIRKNWDASRDAELLIMGEETHLVEDYAQADTGLFDGPAYNTVNLYTRGYYMNYYIGLDIPAVPIDDEWKVKVKIMESDEYWEMSEYPAEGSIREIDGYLVVKLG